MVYKILYLFDALCLDVCIMGSFIRLYMIKNSVDGHLEAGSFGTDKYFSYDIKHVGMYEGDRGLSNV